MRKLDRLQTDDKTLNRIQDRTLQAVNPILNNPLVNGVLSDFVTVPTATVLQHEHKLGREPLGWFAVSQRGSSVIYEDFSLAPDPPNSDKFLYLRASAADTSCKIFVF